MKQKKAKARIAARIADFNKLIDKLTREGKSTSGYHKPGSARRV